MSLKVISHGVQVQKATFHAIGDNPVMPTGQEEPSRTGAPAPQPGAVPQPSGPSTIDLNVSSNGNASSVDLSTLGPRGGEPQVELAIASDSGHGTVAVPLAAPPGDRNRGWAQLICSVPNVLAYQLFDREDTVVLIRWPGPADFMSALPDDWTLGDVSLCGTHESAATTGMFISKCQDRDVATQLNEGVRVFDIRLRLNNGELETYHGIRPQYSTLKVQLDAIDSFLAAHPRESVMVSIKEETPPDVPEFSKAVYDTLKRYGDRFVFGEHVARLGELRGRAQVMTRFGRNDSAPWAEGLGFHPSRWPDSLREGFECDCNGIPVRISDWYAIDTPLDIPTKTDCVIQSLTRTTTSSPGSQITLAFSSAAKFPLATPQWVAKGIGAPSFGLGMEGVNARLAHWLIRQAAEGRRPRAIVMADFYEYTGSGTAGLGSLLGALNFVQ